MRIGFGMAGGLRADVMHSSCGTAQSENPGIDAITESQMGRPAADFDAVCLQQRFFQLDRPHVAQGVGPMMNPGGIHRTFAVCRVQNVAIDQEVVGCSGVGGKLWCGGIVQFKANAVAGPRAAVSRAHGLVFNRRLVATNVHAGMPTIQVPQCSGNPNGQPVSGVEAEKPDAGLLSVQMDVGSHIRFKEP